MRLDPHCLWRVSPAEITLTFGQQIGNVVGPVKVENNLEEN